MKKVLLTLLTLLLVNSAVFAFPFFKKDTTLTTVPLFSTKTKAENTVWVGTCQLVWNDLMNDIVRGEVMLEGGNDDVVKGLNKQSFSETMLSENSYYKTHGIMTTTLRDTINTSLMEKFNETSDLLAGVDWNGRDYLLYAMLKKDFQFPYVYDKLAPEKFGSSREKVKYFGVINKSDKKLRNNIQVLFYNSADEYAVKLLTKENEDVILYRTDKEDSFTNLYNYIAQNAELDSFTEKDVLQIPDINVDETISYNDLCGKKIQGSDYIISQALQTIKFKMDNKGGSLKSEAAIIAMRTALRPPVEKPRFFLFNKRFILFLKEADKDKPYYAMSVEDSSSLVKEN